LSGIGLSLSKKTTVKGPLGYLGVHQRAF